MGEAAAKHLAGLGAPVVLGARRTDRIEMLAKEIHGNGGKAIAIATDITQRDQVKNMVDTAVEKLDELMYYSIMRASCRYRLLTLKVTWPISYV
jgi:NADP-dependent 3-hydroxy acid dehydrogenase YdfG